jgi:hypothetical protein
MALLSVDLGPAGADRPAGRRLSSSSYEVTLVTEPQGSTARVGGCREWPTGPLEGTPVGVAGKRKGHATPADTAVSSSLETSDPDRRRRAVLTLIDRLVVSQRHACRWSATPGHQRNVAAMSDDDEMAPSGPAARLLTVTSAPGMETGGRDRPESGLAGQQQADRPPLALRRPQSPLPQAQKPTA